MNTTRATEKPTPGMQMTKNQGVIPNEIILFYFPIMGRADPIRQMFEYHGQAYKKIDVDQAYWNEKKAADEGGEFG